MVRFTSKQYNTTITSTGMPDYQPLLGFNYTTDNSILYTTKKKCENAKCFLFRAESAETDAAVMTVEAHPGKRLSE